MTDVLSGRPLVIAFNSLQIRHNICDPTHQKRQVGQRIKIDFMLFPKWLFFLLNFGAKVFEIGHCILEMWQFH